MNTYVMANNYVLVTSSTVEWVKWHNRSQFRHIFQRNMVMCVSEKVVFNNIIK